MKHIEFILMMAASLAIGLIPWRDMPWSLRIIAALGILAYFAWVWRGAYKEWKEIKARPRPKPEDITEIRFFVTREMLIAIVFGVIGIIWILWAGALGKI